jgi:hypothetical protein
VPASVAPPEAVVAKVESAPPAAGWDPVVLAKWTHLNRMMSRTAVRALLGPPKWIDPYSVPHLEYWLYKDPTIHGEGWIAFF